MFGIDGELKSCKSFIFARAPALYCGSSFSSCIGALVGDPRLPMVGGEFGPESGVLLLQSNEIITIKINSPFNDHSIFIGCFQNIYIQ